MELVQTLKDIRADLQAIMHSQVATLKLMDKIARHFSDVSSKKVKEVNA